MSNDGLDLVKHFEGLYLEAYLCPSNVLTIGYGHTGFDVKPGMKITEATADQLLKKDMRYFEKEVQRIIHVPLTQHEFDAIVSFTFNVGEGNLQSSTFCRRINNGEDKATCFKEEFPKWVKGANGPLPGLVDRRDAEVKLALTP